MIKEGEEDGPRCSEPSERERGVEEEQTGCSAVRKTKAAGGGSAEIIRGKRRKEKTYTTPSPYDGTPPERTPAMTAKKTAWTAAVPYL